MTIRPPKSNSQGYTLVEMLVVLIIGGIMIGIATPSFLALNKPLRDGSLQFKSQLSLIRSKAISSNSAYRLRPKFTTRSEYPDSIPRNFVVEYASNCAVTATGGTSGWQMASQFDLDLPPVIGITDIASTTFASPFPTSTAITNDLSWNVCFDNRGIVDTSRQFVLKDFQGNNKAKIAAFSVGKLGIIELYTYSDKDAVTHGVNADLNDGQSTPLPVF